MLKGQYIVFCLLITLVSKAKVFDLVIDPFGNGDYTTIQAALNSVKDNQNERTLILVRSGFYEEKLVVPFTKNNVSLIGEKNDKVIISWNDYAGNNGLSSAETYTMLVEGKDFYMENITLQNTAGNIGQALAIRTVGDRNVYKNYTACFYVRNKYLGNLKNDNFYKHHGHLRF